MKEIKTVALIGLGAIGSFLASHLKYALEMQTIKELVPESEASVC